MYAIVDIAGQQFKVEKDQKIFVHHLDAEIGSEVEFDKVLLIEEDGKVKVGEPVITGALISAKVLEHKKGDKVLIFKKKRRKTFQKMTGHRQSFTQILIENIVAEGGAKKPVEKKAKAAPVAEEAKEAVAPKPARAKKAESTEEKPKAVKKTASKASTEAAPKKVAKSTEAKAAAPKKTKKSE